MSASKGTTMSDALFELRGAGFAVGERQLLHPLDLVLDRGRVIGLVGHNGSGKSTLLKLLARQEKVTCGQISFDGQLVDRWPNRLFARQVAYLPQAVPPAPAMLVGELAKLGRYPWHGALGRFGQHDAERTQRALDLTGMDTFSDRFVDTLSGGERQRAWLAMLVAQDASCLLLDEPIAALDVSHQIDVLSLVRDLCRDAGISVVLVLHDINMAARFCDEIVALHSGRLIAQGSPEEIMEPAVLHRIYGIEMDVLPHPANGRSIALPR